MLIKFLQDKGFVKKGQILEYPETTAQPLINQGIAVLASGDLKSAEITPPPVDTGEAKEKAKPKEEPSSRLGKMSLRSPKD